MVVTNSEDKFFRYEANNDNNILENDIKRMKKGIVCPN